MKQICYGLLVDEKPEALGAITRTLIAAYMASVRRFVPANSVVQQLWDDIPVSEEIQHR